MGTARASTPHPDYFLAHSTGICMETIQTVGAAVFWVCAASVFYAYAGYPVVIWCLARWLGRPLTPSLSPGAGERGKRRSGGDRLGEGGDGDLPTVSLLIAAYNEEEVIEKRIESALM